ncbi:MAG TPA: sensor domain-containing diguanylate cyclase [Nitrospirota bacterium]|nr:sensor domain-containing diguanylate cyclase [Nitrospirota bacterium]
MSGTKEQRRLIEIMETAKAVVSQLDLDKVLAVILKKAMEITKTRAGSIALFTAKTGTLRIHAHKGFSRGFISNSEWKVQRGGLTERILKSRGVTVINDSTNKAFFTSSAAVKEGIKSLVCVPLVYSSDVVGILYLDDFTPRKFPSEDLHTLEIMASFAAIAIHNARTHTVILQQANTDSLTGLFNRRSFENVLEREFQRADRHGRELSLALVDVNDFKKFNDTFGHQAGDRALTALGEAVRKAIRSTDFAARYGGDEIAIILPETKLARAYELFSKRIKQKIEEGFTRITNGDLSLTVTIGIASYPRDGKNARDLILSADRALMNAKKMKYTTSIGCSRPVAVA